MLDLSWFGALTAPPMRRSLSWEQLVEQLSTPMRTSCTVANCRGSACSQKDGECWSPAKFVLDARLRYAPNVQSISCLVLDVDHVPEAALGALRDHLARYQHMIHATHSDRPGDRCLRVVVKLSRPVLPNEWKTFARAAVAMVRIPVDSPTIDLGRLFYLPSRPRDADFYVESGPGEALDVDAVLATAPASTPCNHHVYDAACHATSPGEEA